jgi:hypothetical protein
MKDNKLIAEFMGLRDGDRYFSPPLEEAESVGLGMHVYPDEMRYHTSWDWLMPVVRKIDDMFGNDNQIDDGINIVHNAVLSFDIDNTHKAVVEFIKLKQEL